MARVAERRAASRAESSRRAVRPVTAPATLLRRFFTGHARIALRLWVHCCNAVQQAAAPDRVPYAGPALKRLVRADFVRSALGK